MSQQLAEWSRALIAHFLGPGNGELVQAHAQIMATLVTLLFTLLLIPVQEASSKYSSALLRYFRDDRKLRGYLLLLLVLLAIVIVFMLVPPTRWIDYAASASVAVSFVILVAVINRIATMLDVSAFLLPELKQRTQNHLDAAFLAAADEPDSETDDWQRAFEEGSSVGEFARFGETKYLVRGDLRKLQEDILVWKTLGIRLADGGDYQAFEQLVSGLGDITRRYLNERREYRTANDRFLWFLAETFDHLARSAESQANETFSDVLLRTVADCAESAIETNPRVLGAGVGYHKLGEPLSALLKRHAWRARQTGGRTRAYEAIDCYSRVGIALARQGYGLSAIEVAEGTLTFGLEGLDKDPRERVSPLFVRCVRHLVACYASALHAPPLSEVVLKPELERTFIHHEFLALRVLLSLLYQGWHLETMHRLGLRPALESCVTDLTASIASSRTGVTGEQSASLMLFAGYLRKTGGEVGSSALVAVLTARTSSEVYDDSMVLRALEEPVIPLKHEALDRWNMAIFGSVGSAPPAVV